MKHVIAAMTNEERLERLEKQNRKLRRWVAGIAVLALAALVAGTAVSVRAFSLAIEPVNVITQKIFLKDTSNRVRMVLDGTTGIVGLLDATGKRHLYMDSNGYVITSDVNGRTRMKIYPTGNLEMYDENSRLRLLANSSYGTIRFWLSDGRLIQHP